MSEIKINYKGYTIKHEPKNWSDGKELWQLVTKEGSQYENESLTKVKQYIDRLHKADFKEFTVLKEHGRWNSESFQRFTVTSIDDEGNYWVKDSKGSRSKERPDCLLVDNEENEALIKQMKQLDISIASVEKEKSKLEKKLQKCTSKRNT